MSTTVHQLLSLKAYGNDTGTDPHRPLLDLGTVAYRLFSINYRLYPPFCGFALNTFHGIEHEKLRRPISKSWTVPWSNKSQADNGGYRSL